MKIKLQQSLFLHQCIGGKDTSDKKSDAEMYHTVNG